MSQPKPSIISKLNPSVPRHYLFGLAGVLWTVAGVLLNARAIIWLDVFSVSIAVTLAILSIVLAVAGYLFFFVRVVQKNIDRIDNLPEHPCLFAFTAWSGYLMIALMMTVGITLRNTSIPKYFLVVPYAAMGTILLIGSARFFRQFIIAFARRKG